MPLIVGFDTEYTRGTDDFSLPESANNRNRVLSYQLYFLDTETGRGDGLCLAITNGHKLTGRFTLATLLSRGLENARRKGIIARIPNKIILAAHFWRADLPSLRDFSKLKREIDAVRRTYASARQTFVQNLFVNGRAHRTLITMIDTLLLAPSGQQSLAALGELLGVEKINLPDGAIEKMDKLQSEDPDLFERYALRDAEIAAKWVAEILRFFEEDLRLDVNEKPPITLGAAALGMFVGMLDKNELHALLGNRVDGKGVNSRRRHEGVSDHISFFANGFHGGRNEAYSVGYHTGSLTDIDLRGAYTTAMVAIRYPDWNRITETIDRDLLAQPDALSIARVSFRFPNSTRFPSLPVRAGERGLVYPLEGISYATGAELRVAIDQGAHLEVQKGVYVPWADERRPFLEFTHRIAELRRKYPKASALERIAKECGNSLYGKVAQGVTNLRGDHDGNFRAGRKRHFNAREGKMEDLGPSKITQPLLAAFITGFVRAVLSESLARLPDDANVLTATTDGFLSDIGLGQVDTSGPLATLFSELRVLCTGDPMPIEVKGEAAEVIVMKTRGAFATKPAEHGDPRKPILARAGTRLEKHTDDPWDECRELESLYRSRTYELKLTQRRMINLRLQWITESDLVDNEQGVRVNLDYDLKRRPLEVRDVNGVIWFKTAPWQSVDEFNEYRDAFEAWRLKKRQVLRTDQDWAAFLRYKRETALKTEMGVRTSKRPPIVQLFLRAYAHGLLGLPGREFAECANFISSLGWPTKVQNVKDAKRRGQPKLKVASEISDAEHDFLMKAAKRWRGFELSALLQTVNERCAAE